MYHNNLINIKFFFKITIINIILFVISTQFNVLIYASDSTHITKIIDKDFCIHDQPIYIKSNQLKIYYSEKIQFSGNVSVKHNNNILKSDILNIFHNKNNKLQYNMIYASGNIHYYNEYIMLTGDHAWINLSNKNMDIYNSTYYLLESHIHGTAHTIMQRKKNRYTIIKEGKFTSCAINDNYWNITGSEMIYDNLKHKLNIWNACLKIQKIPVFYSPYLSLDLLNDNFLLKNYIPKIQYNNRHGLIFTIPYPLSFSKYFSGNIYPYYRSNLGIKLKSEIRYSIKPGTGVLSLDVIEKNKTYNKKLPNNHYNKYWKLYWSHNGFLNKKWHLNSNYIKYAHKNNYLKNYHNLIRECPNNNCINQKIICNYNNKNWNTNLAYLGITNIKSKAITNHCNYNAKPQLELTMYCHKNQHKPFSLKLFSQLSQFIPTNHYFPKTIRMHIEPILNFTINEYWGYFNTEAKLKITHYQQNNINNHYKINHSKYHLQKTVNRIIPQLKIHGKVILQKKTQTSKIKHFLEPRLQYLYVPYRFQENIGIYDTNYIHIDHKNLFHDTIYSGLDRIAAVNQITGDITLRCFNKKHELLYVSIGQILNLTQYHSQNIKNKYIRTYPNILTFSGISNWNINDHWHINTEIQYGIPNHIFPFGTIILEHIKKNRQILQINYRYINAQYFMNILPNTNASIYHKTISQIGFVTYCPLINNWSINYSHYHNIKRNKLIDQTIGIQYYTSCWKMNISCERKIIDWYKKTNHRIYDNKIRLDIKIYNSSTHFKPDPHSILNFGIFPYQNIS